MLTGDVRVGDNSLWTRASILRRPRRPIPYFVDDGNSDHVAYTNNENVNMLAWLFESYNEVDVSATNPKH